MENRVDFAVCRRIQDLGLRAYGLRARFLIVSPLLFSCGTAWAQSSGTAWPQPLQSMIESRSTLFKTAWINWSMETPFQRDLSYDVTSCYAQNGDFGMTQRKRPVKEEDYRRPAPSYTWSAFRYLLESGGRYWRGIEGAARINVAEPAHTHFEFLRDVRLLGLLDSLGGGEREDFQPATAIENALRKQGSADPVFESKILPNGLYDVTARLDENREMEWQIDQNMDWSPVLFRQTTRPAGQDPRKVEIRLEYQQYDGRWFPSQATYYDGNDVPTWIITIADAEFDRPYHPKQIDKRQWLDIVAGTNVSWIGGPHEGGPFVFDGVDSILSFDEQVKRQRNGTLDFTEFQHRALDGEPRGVLPSRDPKGYDLNSRTQKSPRLWENYTRSFVRVNRLSDEQARKAWEVLRDCQVRAFTYLDSIKENLNDLSHDRALATATINRQNGDSAFAQAAEQELIQLQDREERLMSKVESIFKDLLKPGLFKLLTDEQLKAEAARDFAKVRPEKADAESVQTSRGRE